MQSKEAAQATQQWSAREGLAVLQEQRVSRWMKQSELAFQIADQFNVLGSPLNARTAVVVGGMDMMTQAIELDHLPHVVVATPGRLVDHLNNHSDKWSLERIRYLVD